jgi:hypothetical protein
MINGVVDTGDEVLFKIFIDSKKIEMVPTLYSGAQGQLIHQKNLTSNYLLNTKIVEFQNSLKKSPQKVKMNSERTLLYPPPPAPPPTPNLTWSDSKIEISK